MTLSTEHFPRPSGSEGWADLSLVIPTYDEEHRLPEPLKCLARFADDSGLRVGLIVAEHGTRAHTAAVARRWAAEGGGANFTVRVVTIAHRGKGAAVRAGLRMAQAPVVGYCDADMSAGTDALAALYREVKDGADVAIASRGLAESVLEVR